MSYKVLIIGAGQIGSGYDNPNSNVILTHAHAILASKNFELAGFCDIELEKAQRAASIWGGNAIDNLDQMQEGVDIVCCAAPDASHCSILCDCLRICSIKAVICEKPITNSLSEARKITGFYKDNHIALIVNYTRRFMKEFTQLREQIASMGNLIIGNCFYGKGVIHNCSHFINLFEFLMGKLEIVSIGKIITDYKEEDPSVEFILAAKGGTIFFHPISCDLVTIFEFDLLFENGRVKYSDEEGVIYYYKKGCSPLYYNEVNYLVDQRVQIEQGCALLNLYDNLISVLEGKSGALCSGEDACYTLELCEAIRKGKVIDI